MIRATGWAFSTLCLTFVGAPAHAADQCGDILAKGVFDSIDTSSLSEYQEIIISRFLSSNYEGSKKNSTGIGGKSIGEIVMGNAYNENEYNQKKAFIRQSYDRTLTQTEEWTLATRTANDGIVKAWQSCMDGTSGLVARFETQPGDGLNVTLVLSVKGAMGLNEVTLSSDTTIPADAQVLSQNQYKKCLKQGVVIKATAPCRVALAMPASKPFKMIISTPQGDAEAYLSRRLKWKYSRKPFNITKELTLPPNQSSLHSELIPVSSGDVEAGFTFAPGSVQVTGPERYYGSGDGKCMNYSQTLSATSISYKYLVISTDNMSTSCRLIITAALEKGEFIPDQ